MRLLTPIFIIALLWASPVIAGGFSIYEAGIRANGMMGAFSAFGEHVSTIYYNPAGLATVNDIQFSAGSTLYIPQTEFHNLTPRAPIGEGTAGQNDIMIMPNFFGSYQVEEGLTVGIALYRPFGFMTGWPENWVGRNSSIDASLSTYVASPAIGYTLPDFGIGQIHVGIALQVAFWGKFDYSRALTTFTPEGTFTLETEMKEISFGYNVGILYRPMDGISLGFSFRSPVDIAFKGRADFTNLAVGFPSSTDASVLIPLPASATAAVNFKPLPQLTAEIDFVWWRWSNYERLAIEFGQTIVGLGNDRLVDQRNFDNSWQIRTGFEYSGLLNNTLTVRGGAAFDKSPVDDAFVDAKLPDSDQWLFSGGVTYSVSPAVEIDGSYMFALRKERRVTDTHANLDGIYTGHSNIPSLGITLKF